MGTNSTVGVEQKDGTIKSIYVHFDGYPSYMIPVLESLVAHQDKSGVRMIDLVINEGNASLLGPTLDECVFYSRDRGEDGEECNVHANRKDFMKDSDNHYTYLVDITGDVWKLFKGQ
jgi:hypothetical protein